MTRRPSWGGQTGNRVLLWIAGIAGLTVLVSGAPRWLLWAAFLLLVLPPVVNEVLLRRRRSRRRRS